MHFVYSMMFLKSFLSAIVIGIFFNILFFLTGFGFYKVIDFAK